MKKTLLIAAAALLTAAPAYIALQAQAEDHAMEHAEEAATEAEAAADEAAPCVPGETVGEDGAVVTECPTAEEAAPAEAPAEEAAH